MGDDLILPVDLVVDGEEAPLRIGVVFDPVGETEVATPGDLILSLADLAAPVERIGQELLEAAKRAKPSRAAVALSFGIGFESSGLVAVLGKGKGEASITITLEWSGQGG